VYTVCQGYTTLLYYNNDWQIQILLIFYTNVFHICILKTLTQSRLVDHMMLTVAQPAKKFSNFTECENVLISSQHTASIIPVLNGPNPHIYLRFVFNTLTLFTERLVRLSAQFHCFLFLPTSCFPFTFSSESVQVYARHQTFFLCQLLFSKYYHFEEGNLCKLCTVSSFQIPFCSFTFVQLTA
jgi:hypothetical protein